MAFSPTLLAHPFPIIYRQGTEPAPIMKQPKAWSRAGCPKAYSLGTVYESGDAVSVSTPYDWNTVYACKDGPNNLFCGRRGYEPGEGQYGPQAWTKLGICTGTMTPTDSPVYVDLLDEGGCPTEYKSGVDRYEEGDTISKDGLVYKCREWPNSQHCSQAGYEPAVDVGGVDHWKKAWEIVGRCEGTIQPTSSPSYVSLEDLGGCPNSWERRDMTDPYEEGELVSTDGLVYACKAWPTGAHCGQDGYEPNVNPATPDAWKDAWVLKGFCNGSIGPTSSPNYDPVKIIGACPEEWVEGGGHTKYEEGDMVSLTVSEVPLRKVVFKCKVRKSHCKNKNWFLSMRNEDQDLNVFHVKDSYLTLSHINIALP